MEIQDETLSVAQCFQLKDFAWLLAGSGGGGGGGGRDKARLCGAGLYQVNINI